MYDLAQPPRLRWRASIDRIGTDAATLRATGAEGASLAEVPLHSVDHAAAAGRFIDWLDERGERSSIAAVGHRVVHGGLSLLDPQPITPAVLAELRKSQPLDLSHLPREIALIEAFAKRLAGVPQVACFDTAFHRDLPAVAKRLPIPRRMSEAGVRRLGFHGLSYTFLLGELQRIAPNEAAGRIVFAHLGSGASLAAVHGGRAIDTTMAFTPLAGLVMATRPGDLDPGLVCHIMRTEKFSPDQMDEFLSKECGLLGVSQTSGDMRDLQSRRTADPRAAEAIDLFCYQAKKFVAAMAAAMGGLDGLVFAGGIGEHSPAVRAQICDGLSLLGVTIDAAKNQASAPIISGTGSDPGGRVVVRVMQTDEEIVIAETTCRVLKLHS